MSKKLFRGSLFLSLMLILSITLSGCSFDFSKIISGVKNVLGKVVTGIGSVIKKGVDVVKKGVEVAKPVVSSVANAVGEFTGNKDNIVSKIDSGMNKVDGALDKVSNFGQKLEDTGNKLTDNGKDSAGNNVSDKVSTKQTVANPNKDTDETESNSSNSSDTTKTNNNTDKTNKSNNTNNTSTTIVCTNPQNCSSGNCSTDNNNSNNNTGKGDVVTKVNKNSEEYNTRKKEFLDKADALNKNNKYAGKDIDLSLLSEADKKTLANDIKTGVSDISANMNRLKTELKNDTRYITSGDANGMISDIDSCLKDLEEIKKDPTSASSIDKYNEVKKKFNEIKNKEQNLSMWCHYCRDRFVAYFDGFESYVNYLDETIGSIKKS